MSRRYGSVYALRQAHVHFQGGQVHAVVGENGAGKTTLMRLLAAEERPDEGEVLIDGQVIRMDHPRQAQQQGIAVVHQQFQLVDTLTVSENLFLGRAPERFRLGPLSVVNRNAMREAAAQRLQPFGLEGQVDQLVRDLGVAQRQLIEIAKALGEGPRIVIFDEPTASLSTEEADRLLDLIRQMTSKGVCVILIAHSLEEVLSIADRITVLRAGEVITTVNRAEVDRATLVRLIVGRELAERSRLERTTSAQELLRVQGMVQQINRLPIDLSLQVGEVVGIPTYIGAEVDRFLFKLMGLDTHQSLRINLDGEDLSKLNMPQRLHRGLCMVPGDTLRQGLVPTLSVQENIALPNARRLSRLGFWSASRVRNLAARMIELMNIRPASAHAQVARLSGGNRQKVVIAKWLAAAARVLLMDDPTKAVDVGAKQDIYRLMQESASQGVGVILVSSDMDELLSCCDRIWVLHQQSFVAEFDGRRCDKQQLMDAVVRSRSHMESHPPAQQWVSI